MSEQVQRKLVGADRYMSQLLGSKLVERNEIIAVSAEVADKLDEDTYVNALGETRKYFAKVKPSEAVEDGDEPDEDDTDVGTASKRQARSRTTKAAKTHKVAEAAESGADEAESGSED